MPPSAAEFGIANCQPAPPANVGTNTVAIGTTQAVHPSPAWGKEAPSGTFWVEKPTIAATNDEGVKPAPCVRKVVPIHGRSPLVRVFAPPGPVQPAPNSDAAAGHDGLNYATKAATAVPPATVENPPPAIMPPSPLVARVRTWPLAPGPSGDQVIPFQRAIAFMATPPTELNEPRE